MLRKTLTFVASLLAVVLLLGSQNATKADSIYMYAYSGNPLSMYSIAYGGSDASGANPWGTIYHYNMYTGDAYNGFITSDIGGTITSFGYYNGWNFASATSKVAIVNGQPSVSFVVRDYYTQQVIANLSEGNMDPIVGYQYIW